MKTSLQTSRNALHFFRIGYVQRTVTIMHRFLLSVILFISVNASAQVTQTFNTNGTFTVPAGVNSITVGCWGGGGAGGTRTSNGVAGGGGGGAYSSSVIAVTPGDTYSFVVGAGGTSGSPATAGGDTWFGSATTVMAKGGNSVATNSQTGATGGAAGPGFGTIKNNGGNGRNGNTSGTDYGGGGGSSAGIAIGANGNNATTNAGANAPAGGGDGGDGRFSSQGNGQPGNVPGGGGGGALRTSSSTRTGGAGAVGQVSITYTQLTYKSSIISVNTGAGDWCPGETRNISITVQNTGTATWTDAGPDINIGIKWNTNGANWTDYHIRTDAGVVAPGDFQTYIIPLTASNHDGAGYTTQLAPGTNNISVDLVYEGISWFGDNDGGVGPGNAAFVSPAINIKGIPTSVIASASPNAVCENATLTLTASATGAESWDWSGPDGFTSALQNPVINNITIAAAGVYTLTASNSCGSAGAVTTSFVTVNQLPAVSAGFSVCIGSTLQLTPSSGGTWISNNASIASVTNTGLVTGLQQGSTTFTFTDAVTGCSNTTTPVSVLPRPTAQITSTDVSICKGSSTNITGTVVATGDWTLTLNNGATATGSGNSSFSITVSPAITTSYSIASLTDFNCASIPGDLTGTVTVTVNDPVAISVQPQASQTVCSSFPASFSVTATGTGLTYQWYAGATALTNNANISGATGPTLTIAQASMADAGVYHVVVSGLTPCSPVTSDDAVLTVIQDIEITAQPATAMLCTGATATFTVTATGAGLSYQWRRGAATLVDGGRISGVNTATLTITNINAGDAAANYNVVISGSGGVCPQSISADAALVVYPVPDVAASPLSQAACSGVNITSIQFTGSVGGTTFNWVRDNPGITGSIATSGSGNIVGNLVNSTNVPVTVTFTVTPVANGCPGTAITVTVLVNPTPDAVASVSSQSICTGSSIIPIGFSSAVAGTIYNWVRDNPAVTGTIANSGSGNISGTLINNSPLPVTVTFSITPVANGCPGIPAIATVLVKPSPVAVATPASQSVCNGIDITQVVLSSATPGTTFSWVRDNPAITGSIGNSGTGNISGTFINSGNIPVTVTFTITPTADGCPGTPILATVLVNPVADAVAAPNSQSICSGLPINMISLTGNTAGATYSWIRDNTVPVTGLPGSGSGNISGTLNNTTNTAITVSFTVTPVINSCPGTPVTATVLVEPSPVVTATPVTQSICNNTLFTVTLNNPNNVAGTNYTWTRNNVINLTGVANSGSGSVISGTFVNGTAITQTSAFAITATAGNGCTGSATAIVNVYATQVAPVVSEAQTVCIFSTPAMLTGTAATGGNGTFSYQWQSSLDNITWNNIGGATNLTYQPPAVNGGTQNTYYRLRAIGSCGTIFSNAIYIEVVSGIGFTFDVDDGLTSSTICPGTIFTPLISSVHFSNSAVRYTWSANPAYIAPASGGPVGTTSGVQFFFFRTSSGSIGPLTALNATNAPVTTTITLVPNVYEYPGPPSGAFICSTTPQYVTVTINPTPTVNAISNQVVCNNAATSAVNFSGFVPGTVYNWVNNTPSIGLAASGTGNIGSFTAINAGTVPVTATITVTPSYTNAGRTCTGTPKTFTITVNPSPTVNTIANQVVCNNASTSAINFTGSVTGTVYNWTNNNTSIGLGANGSGNIPSFTAINTGLIPVTATITVTPSYTNASTTCSGTQRTFTITVNPDVTAGTINGTSPLCIGATTTYSSTGNSGGTWTSSNPAVASVNPSTGFVTALSAGITNIVYTVTSGCNSPATALKQLTVSPDANSGTVTGNTPLCIGSTALYSSNGDAGGTWSSSNTLVATVNPATGLVTAINPGTATITYTLAGCNAVPASATVTVSANANAGTINGVSPLCPGSASTYTTTGNPGGVWSTSNVLIATVDASTGLVTAVSPGTVNIIYTVSTGCNSPVSSARPLTVAINASAGIVTGPSPLCIGSNAFYFSSGDPGGTWSSSNTLVATVNPVSGFVTVTGTGSADITYTVNTGCNSPVSSTKTLTVNQPPPATPSAITGSTAICASTPGLIYSVAPVVNATTYTWTVPAGWSIISGQGTNTVTVTAGNNSGNVSVYASNFCGNSGVRNLSVTVSASGTWLGIASNDWNNAANWCGGIPGPATNVIIPAGTPNNPVISSAASSNNLQVATGATLTISNALLQVGGTIAAVNNMYADNGTIELNGSTQQIIPANVFHNNALGHLIINNSSEVQLNGVMDIYGSLTYGTNGTDFKTNNFLTLKSTLANTAWIGNMTGKVIEGDVTVERYIPNHSKAWQFLSVPVSGIQTINEAWQDSATFANQNRYPGYGTMLTSNLPGAIALGFDAYTAPGPSIKIYNSATGGYNGVASTKTTPINNPRGYMVMVRGDRSVTAFNQPATATVLRTKGKLFTPADQPPVTNVMPGRFESIGNPYASAIDFAQVAKSGGVQTDFFYMWDPKLTITSGAGANSPYGLGGFQTFSWNGSSFDVTPGGGSYSGTNRYIESGQAFFVAAPFAGGTVSFNENCKVSGSNDVNRVMNRYKQLRSNLYVMNGADQVLLDGNLVQYDASFSNEVDVQDAMKLNNAGENLGLNNNGKILAIERRAEIVKSDTIHLNLGQVRVKQYMFEFVPYGLHLQGLVAFLEDDYLHQSTPLNMDDTTWIMFNIINEPGSYAVNRFSIVFRKLAPVPVFITGISATRNTDKTTTVNWKVENETGLKGYTIERSADGRNFEGILTVEPAMNNGGSAMYTQIDLGAYRFENYYRIKATSYNGMLQLSPIVKVAPEKNTGSFEIFPNPVTDRKINLAFNDIEPGMYKISILNMAGQELQTNSLQVMGAADRKIVIFDHSIPSGTYQLNLVKPGGEKMYKTIIIK